MTRQHDVAGSYLFCLVTLDPSLLIYSDVFVIFPIKRSALCRLLSRFGIKKSSASKNSINLWVNFRYIEPAFQFLFLSLMLLNISDNLLTGIVICL